MSRKAGKDLATQEMSSMRIGVSAHQEATVRAIAIRWSCEEVYSPPLRRRPFRRRLSTDSPSMVRVSPEAEALTPIWVSIFRIAVPRSLSLLANLLNP